MTARKRSADIPGKSDAPSTAADRRWVLELLDGSRERHESAHPNADNDAFVYFAHLSAARQLTELYYRRVLKPHRISDSEYRVISGLRVRGKGFKTTPLELNRFVQITSAGMTRSLDRLEDAGYIERSPNPEDRRSILVGLTREGWDFANVLNRDLNTHHADALGDVPRKDLKREIDQLRVIVERLAKAALR